MNIRTWFTLAAVSLTLTACDSVNSDSLEAAESSLEAAIPTDVEAQEQAEEAIDEGNWDDALKDLEQEIMKDEMDG